MPSMISRFAICATTPVVACALLAFAPIARADSTDQEKATTGQAVAHDGLSAATAAASCWDIKQRDSKAADGTYWLQTPAMDHPAQFYCDQTTDGGGWVLIGRGREGWEGWSGGKGDPAKLTARDRNASAFGVVQYSNATVNQLLNNEAVKDQADGVRVLRARNSSGSEYQKLDLQFAKMTDFVWPFKMGHPVKVSFDGGGQASDNIWTQVGRDERWNALQVYPSSHTGWTIGWGYGPDVADSGGDLSSASSFLHKNGSTVFPYAETYVRPRIASDSSAFSRIPDGGVPASTVTRAVSQYAAPTKWGVTGNLNGSVKEGNIQVQAFAQVGSTMYVAGNFTGVKQGENGSVVPSKGLAAFDVATGNHTGQTFDFNGQVKALVPLPNGKLLAAGDFTRVGGESHVGTAVIDPATGKLDPSWDVTITNGLRGGAVSVRAATYHDGYIYLGGSFTHLNSGGKKRVYGRNAARISLDGNPDRTWNPELNGAVQAVAVNESNKSFYAGGHFTRAHGGQRAWYAAKFSTEAGAAVDTGFDFKPSTVDAAKYQQTISSASNRVFIGGSEHSLFGYDAASNQRTSGSVTMRNGGDLQASTISANGVIYASCHCSDGTYQDKYDWEDNHNWSRVDEIKWVGAWDATTGESLRWTPFELLSQRRTGAWALTTDTNGNLWVGGDFTLSYTDATHKQWNGGFARYDSRDNAAPATPSGLRGSSAPNSSVTLSWEGVSDAASYEVLRDDRAIASTDSTSVTVPLGGENRFFVRAVDAAGNRSATTPVYKGSGDGQAAPPSGQMLLEAGATWSYRAENSAAPDNWAQASFDDSQWPTGAAPLGYGDSRIATQLAAKGARPVTTYFRSRFQVSDTNALKGVNVKYLADDGAVVYINGAEVHRTRMGKGTVSYATRADSAPRYNAAAASLSEVFVPASALKNGDNVIAVETHVNYLRSVTMAMQASVSRVEGAPDSSDGGDAQPQPQPQPREGELKNVEDASKSIDATGVKSGTVIPSGAGWNYWTATSEPASDWASSASLEDWSRGAGPIGWGDPKAGTPLDIDKKSRAITNYFARDIDLGTVTSETTLTVKVRADDGAVLRVNGEQVATKRMTDGDIGHTTFADVAVSASKASSDMLEVTIPANLLKNGVNRIGVEEHLNYRGTSSMSFDLSATVAR
ncbi:galactose oxidase [Schaalia meyeri]|uniref:Galactose oxidase n=1 Tax=Schaalia meyeri TaxID=52773 RepID=A0AAQ0BVE0_9ACTO|nr:fibrinogen-like YCDxxxxGGGW domain-containing protein [Schaalia meyeri]QQC43254.1 galactose oxidase [Schaalia meyeri]SDR64434.1 hypothetical protein SAMN04489715_0052 [Schaalia meyeri]